MPRRPAKTSKYDKDRDAAALDKLERRKLELDPHLDPWEIQPRESQRNYGLFQMYRDSGRMRSIAQIAAMTDVMSYAGMTRLGRYNLWAQRAAAWDAEQDRITAIRLLDAREDMARRHMKLAASLTEKALARLQTINLEKVSMHAVILALDTAAKIERAALGLEGPNRAATTVTVAATSTTDDDGKPEMRVEVGVQHDKIMATLDAMVQRMSPEQLAAGYQELTASADEATRELDAALPVPPPQ